MNIQLAAVEVVALLRDFQLGRVRAEDGRTFAFDAQTVGLRWDSVRVGQRLRCVLALEPRRVLIMTEASLLDLRGMLTPAPETHVEIDEMNFGSDPIERIERKLDTLLKLVQEILNERGGWVEAAQQLPRPGQRVRCRDDFDQWTEVYSETRPLESGVFWRPDPAA